MNELLTAAELHTFPVPPELGDTNFTELAERARARFMGELSMTSLEHSPLLSHGDNEVHVKRTDELPGANFKYLSATTAVVDLLETGHTEFAVATAGSYGIGVAHAVKTYGGIASVFVPEGTNPELQEQMTKLGVTVHEYGSNFDESLAEAKRYADSKNVKLLHPFANTSNIAGTGIIGLELLEQCPEMTHLVLQFGGGSLVSGVASVVKEQRPDVQVVVAQAAACDPFLRSLESGEAQEVADPMRMGQSFFSSLGGVGVGQTDPMTLGLGSQVTDETVRVHIDDVYGTMHDFHGAHGVLPEVASAHGQEGARLWARSPHVDGATIVTVLTGSNAGEYLPGYLEKMSRRRAAKYGS